MISYIISIIEKGRSRSRRVEVEGRSRSRSRSRSTSNQSFVQCYNQRSIIAKCGRIIEVNVNVKN